MNNGDKSIPSFFALESPSHVQKFVAPYYSHDIDRARAKSLV
jgi:hypothetical protein